MTDLIKETNTDTIETVQTLLQAPVQASVDFYDEMVTLLSGLMGSLE